jgi:RNA polymerase sigma factor (sigma-70 family)
MIPLLSTVPLTAEEVEGNCQWEPLRGAGAGYAAIGTPLDKEQRQQKRGRKSQPWLVAKPDIPLEAAYAQGIHSDDFLHWVRYQAGTTFLRNFFPSDQRRDQLISDVLYAVLRTDADGSIQNPRAWLKKIIRRKFADLLSGKNRIESREKMVDTHELRDCSTDPSEGQLEEPVDDLADFPDDMKQIIRLKLMGYTVEEIANRLGLGQEAIQKRFVRYVAEIKSSKMSDFDANCGPKLM